MDGLADGMHVGYTGGVIITIASFPISKKYGIRGFTKVRVGNEVSDMKVVVGVYYFLAIMTHPYFTAIMTH